MSLVTKPDRTTLLFLGFLLVIGVLFGLNYFVTRQTPEVITVAVDPLAEDWVRAAADAYNASNPIINNTTRVRVEVSAINDLDVFQNDSGWSSSNHPTAWIASSSFSVEYASLPLEMIAGSTARTPLVWGGFEGRVAIITQDGGRPFEWQAVQDTVSAQTWSALGASGGNINMAMEWPTGSMAGIGVLLSAAANEDGSDVITREIVQDLGRALWFGDFKESISGFQNPGGDPAQVMAAQGTAKADFGLLPESQWLVNIDGLTRSEGLVFAYPGYQFMLDFPLVRWDDAQVTELEIAAVQSFADYLLSAQGQSLAMQYGLRPAQSEPTESAALFATGEPYGIEYQPDYQLAVLPESRAVIDALLRLLD
ncbi:MAG: substrate-binding domain-containing protein [Anaerolineae bacterium]|nr:substrate-binding domain-containing protein [Anaerolineae bacterium]